MTERRIQVDAQGNMIGGGFGAINNHDTFKGDDGMAKHMISTASWPDGKSPSIMDGIKGQFPITPAPSIFPQTTGQSSISQSVSYVPLTGMQRLTELKKKITEYKSLLTVINDATAKSFVTLLLSNIEKELGEIQVELGRNQVTTPTITPGNPSMPYGPIPRAPEPWPNIGPGIMRPLDDLYPKVGDFPGIGTGIIGPRWDAVAYTVSDSLSQNNIEGL